MKKIAIWLKKRWGLGGFIILGVALVAVPNKWLMALSEDKVPAWIFAVLAMIVGYLIAVARNDIADEQLETSNKQLETSNRQLEASNKQLELAARRENLVLHQDGMKFLANGSLAWQRLGVQIFRGLLGNNPWVEVRKAGSFLEGVLSSLWCILREEWKKGEEKESQRKMKSSVRDEIIMSLCEIYGNQSNYPLPLRDLVLDGIKFGHGLSLTAADFTEAELRKAEFGWGLLSQPISLVRANFSGAKLVGAKFREADLTRADFTKAELIDARFIGAIRTLRREILLNFAKFNNAELVGAKFQEADLSDAEFQEADLRKAEFFGVPLCKDMPIKLVKANFSGAKLAGAKFQNADLTGANFVGSKELEEIELFEGIKACRAHKPEGLTTQLMSQINFFEPQDS